MFNPLVAGVPVVTTAPDPTGMDRNQTSVLDGSAGRLVIDGTPLRVVTLAGAAALSLVALRWAGFKFNVGVST